jgi:hypothetical protein
VVNFRPTSKDSLSVWYATDDAEVHSWGPNPP